MFQRNWLPRRSSHGENDIVLKVHGVTTEQKHWLSVFDRIGSCFGIEFHVVMFCKILRKNDIIIENHIPDEFDWTEMNENSKYITMALTATTSWNEVFLLLPSRTADAPVTFPFTPAVSS